MILFGTKTVGSRLATRVAVKHGAFEGERGMVVKVVHPGAIMVRMLTGHWVGQTLPFGQSELEIK